MVLLCGATWLIGFCFNTKLFSLSTTLSWIWFFFSLLLSSLPCFPGRVPQLGNEAVYVISLLVLVINFSLFLMEVHASYLH